MNMKFQISKVLIYVLCLGLSTNCLFLDYYGAALIDLPRRYINSDVKITIPKGWNSFLIDDLISIKIENVGKDQIKFSNDFGLELFQWNGSGWIRVDLVETNYLVDEYILKPYQKEIRDCGTTDFIPIIVDKRIPARLRIIVYGKRMVNHQVSNVTVAAYKDIWIYPEE